MQTNLLGTNTSQPPPPLNNQQSFFEDHSLLSLTGLRAGEMFRRTAFPKRELRLRLTEACESDELDGVVSWLCLGSVLDISGLGGPVMTLASTHRPLRNLASPSPLPSWTL